MVDTIRLEDGKILLDGGDIAISEDCCCEPPDCSNVCNDVIPSTIDVTIDGVANKGGGGDCTDCNDHNTTYQLPFSASGSLGGSTWYCTWLLTGILPCSDNPPRWVKCTFSYDGSDYSVEVQVEGDSVTDGLYQHDFGASKPDCVAYLDLGTSIIDDASSTCEFGVSTAEIN